MCTCASCVYTDAFAGLPDLTGYQRGTKYRAGFENWPRAEPAGRKSAADYTAHVAHSRIWGGNGRRHPPEFPNGVSLAPLVYRTPKALDPHGRYTFPQYGGPNFTAAEYIAEFIKANNLVQQKSKSPTKRRARARPASPCKVPQHFPAQDRPRETEQVYRKVGRPSLGVKRVLVTLDAASLDRGRLLGAGNLSAGIRKALSANAG